MTHSEGLLADPSTIAALAGDLLRIRDGTGPSAADLASAPILDGWTVSARLGCALHGQVSGHPRLATRTIVTSELFALDREHLMWARTYSRWYRLGRRSGDLPNA